MVPSRLSAILLDGRCRCRSNIARIIAQQSAIGHGAGLCGAGPSPANHVGNPKINSEPQRLKPDRFSAINGTTEVVPSPNRALPKPYANTVRKI
jgi:hypothetical protein